MRSPPLRVSLVPYTELFNLPTIEVLPATSLRARSVATARRMSRGGLLVRAKVDGRYLALLEERNSGPVVRWLVQPPLRGEARRHLPSLPVLSGLRRDADGVLPFVTTRRLLDELRIPADYGSSSDLPEVPEPVRLAFAGRDRYRRPLWLLQPAAEAWQRMRRAALRDGVVLLAISGYRSHLYQAGIFRRKLARGQSIGQILSVNAAPGYSEHHGGCALDIGCAGEPPAEESFELTPQFAWLTANAGRFGFVMSYPRDNPHGILYEPWHWCWRGSPAAAAIQA